MANGVTGAPTKTARRTPSRQSRNQAAYRRRNFEALRCVYCGKSSITYACDECRRRHNIQTIYTRWFKRLFT